MTATADSIGDRAARYSSAQRRTLDVALALFAQYAVAGTSLQMIADELGVTKAAVYHQFNTKEAIVHGVLDVQLQPVEVALDEAEASGHSRRSREALLDRLIDLVMTNRRALATLQNDVVLFRVIGEHEQSRRLFERLYAVLLDDLDDSIAMTRAAVLSATIGAIGHPFAVGVDDDTLRDEIRRIGRRLLRPSG